MECLQRIEEQRMTQAIDWKSEVCRKIQEEMKADLGLPIERMVDIKTATPDLLLTDVYLPGISARDTMRLIEGLCPKLPVLMVSGLPDNEVIREWTGDKHAFEAFPKPFAPRELLDKVRGML